MWESISLQGNRIHMEDRFLVAEEFLPEYSMYAVFDGHGGDYVAQFCHDHILGILQHELVDRYDEKDNIKNALVKTFLKLDSMLSEPHAYTTGSTCLVVLKHRDTLWVANSGDSRAIMNNLRLAVPLSTDHKPNLQEERDRIYKHGGRITKSFGGVWRVNGELALSRAIGDKKLRPLVICTPEITKFALGPDNKFFILATDGVWDLFGNHAISNVVYNAYLSDSRASDSTVMELAKTMLLGLLDSHVDDNTTLVLVHIRR